MPDPIATQYYIPENSSTTDIQAAGRLAMKNYEHLNSQPNHGPLQPAGVYVGKNWIPAGEASTYQKK